MIIHTTYLVKKEAGNLVGHFLFVLSFFYSDFSDGFDEIREFFTFW